VFQAVVDVGMSTGVLDIDVRRACYGCALKQLDMARFLELRAETKPSWT
jgi:hypothetical protein